MMVKKKTIFRWLKWGTEALLLSILLSILPARVADISPPPCPPRPLPDVTEDSPSTPSPPEFTFPVPEGLQTRVDFWKKIFGRYDRTFAVIHDEWYMDVIYEVIDMSSFGRRPMDKVEAIRDQYQSLLKETASARNTPELIKPEARRIWQLFKNVRKSPLAPVEDAHLRVRIQQGRADCFKQGIAWSGRYIDMMKKVMKSYHLPEDLAYLPMVESTYNAYSVSYKGAEGLWQIMRRTARQYNLRMDHLVDERRDPVLATRAAAEHLAHNYEVLESWPLAVTAYNRGLQGMVTAHKTVGSKKLGTIIRKYDSKKFLFSSRNFYAEFLAIVHICHHLDTYFSDIDIADPHEVIQFKMPDYVSVDTFERFLGISAEQLRVLNPALQETVFTEGFYIPKGYTLNIPAVQKPFIKKGYAAIPDHLKFVDAPASQNRHRVRRGETLSEIAKIHATTSKALMLFNGIRNPKRIRVGQHLKIPGKYMPLNE